MSTSLYYLPTNLYTSMVDFIYVCRLVESDLRGPLQQDDENKQPIYTNNKRHRFVGKELWILVPFWWTTKGLILYFVSRTCGIFGKKYSTM